MPNDTKMAAVGAQVHRRVRRQRESMAMAHNAQQMRGCKCTFTQYMVGDGCDVCNPAKALVYARYTMADLQAHRDMLDKALREAQNIIAEMCACHKHPEPCATMERIQKALDFDA